MVQIVKPEAILASNTSSISITRIAAVTKRNSQVVRPHCRIIPSSDLSLSSNYVQSTSSCVQVGMHFMNPVPVMPLVEIIRGIATSDEARLLSIYSKIVFRLLRALLNEVILLKSEMCMICPLAEVACAAITGLPDGKGAVRAPREDCMLVS